MGISTPKPNRLPNPELYFLYGCMPGHVKGGANYEPKLRILNLSIERDQEIA